MRTGPLCAAPPLPLVPWIWRRAPVRRKILSARLVLPKTSEEVSRKCEKDLSTRHSVSATDLDSFRSGRCTRSSRKTRPGWRGRVSFQAQANPGLWRAVFLECHRRFLAKSSLVDAALDSTAGGRPNFLTTQWGLVAAASAEGAAEARAALDELYRLYCYPVYAFIRRRGYGRQDAQDLTQDFFVHLLEKERLGPGRPAARPVPQLPARALDHFLAHAAERARAGNEAAAASGCYLDDDAAENHYQLAAPRDDGRETLRGALGRRARRSNACAAARASCKQRARGTFSKRSKVFCSGGEDASYQQVADGLSLSLGRH